jgi:hypothetical protein
VVSESKLSAPAAEWFSVELGAIIRDKGIGYSETTNDRSPVELDDIAGSHGRQRFRFCPLREIVHSYHQEPLFPFPGRHRTTKSTPHLENGQGDKTEVNLSGGFFIIRVNR